MAIIHVFNSTSAIKDVNRKLFVGREDKIAEGVNNLRKTGAVLGVFGEKGIGKTSYIWQLLSILSGKSELLSLFNIHLSIELPKICIYIECTKKMQNLDGIIYDLLFRRSDDINQYSEISLSEIFENLINKKDANYHSELLSKMKEAEKERNNKEINIDIVELFLDVADYIVKETKQDIIVAIDELETLPDLTGMGDFFKLRQRGKSVFEPKIRYILSGASSAYEDLMTDHESFIRKVLPIPLDRLNSEAISDFFKNAEKLITDINIHFDNDFIEMCFQFSDGYPPIVQAMGEAVIDLLILRKIPLNEEEMNYIDKNIFPKVIDKVAEQQMTRYSHVISPLHAKIDNSGKTLLIEKMLSYTHYFDKIKVSYNEEGRRINNSITNINLMIQDKILEAHEHKPNYLRFKFSPFRFILKYEQFNNIDFFGAS